MSQRSFRRRAATWLVLLLATYLVLAYVAAPEFWTFRDRGFRSQSFEMVTHTPQGIPGDPINVGLIGTQKEVVHAFAVAGWDTADAITLRTAIDIGESVLFSRPYPDAPVSRLLFEGRAQDLAFEKPVGGSADRRHHVRFWQTDATGDDGRPLRLGSASFDRGVGLSHDTGAITHHIGPDIDAERDFLIQDLTAAGMLISTSELEGIGATTHGRNGGGDPYFTDGKAVLGVLKQLP
ncbi:MULTISPECIES: LssY C-terminal domain-containing protein [unclassified Mesorhizobium]|uniref:LssY C-terminal domain-containing protein n=1 Tax=unclassified Mesorhizobium TaxID=325217 RepID=UPI001CCA0EC8|nr:MULTISPECIES: LssY C-terminal domain-containing protein [unclassified Mesorhizobium]MBZ9918953.1 LssY C-terminal domain-containing protein [Mesorhizobium sp. BR1-1-7]MBZ9955484.1 LssY C-terminal domain-containing protein [Mesorhizobium sp. BR1-1-15]MBZ9972403.1 LssY C-terminal domain-containing protein [Mesorhizobium sp. BR1-1-12]